MPNAEKVVKPPSRPIMRKARACSLSGWRASASPGSDTYEKASCGVHRQGAVGEAAAACGALYPSSQQIAQHGAYEAARSDQQERQGRA